MQHNAGCPNTHDKNKDCRKSLNPISCGEGRFYPSPPPHTHGGFSILAAKRFGVGIRNFVTLFIIDFRVMRPCKMGGAGLGRTFSAGIIRFSCFFRLPLWTICSKYSSIIVYNSYSSDCMHCWQRRDQENNMGGDDS